MSELQARDPAGPEAPLTELELVGEGLSDRRMLIDRLHASFTRATS